MANLTVIDKYFSKKNISTRFNTLGYDNTLIRAYLKDFQTDVHNTSRQASQDIKHACYNKLYPVKSRPKFTGFETLKTKDREFRKNIGVFIRTPQFSPLYTVEQNDNDGIDIDYKTALVESVKKIENPIVYLSGGLDSEIVANAFIEAGKKFVPMIFYYVNESGDLLNKHDIGYAYSFCKKHGLFPVIKQINITKLWDSTEFKKLAIDLQIVSPQLVTYAYMIEMVDAEYKNSTHVFGGEVRFTGDYSHADRKYNIVFLDKLQPAYDGEIYSTPIGLYGEEAYIALQYNGNSLTRPGEWLLITYLEGLGSPVIQASGVWTTTPELGPYQVTVTAVTINFRNNPSVTDYFPKVADIPYNIIVPSYGTYVCDASAGPVEYSQAATMNATWNISCRVQGEVSPIIYSSITLVAAAEYT